MRLLFVKLGSIGDIVHTLPALSVARRAFPDAVIDWVAESRSAEILRGNGQIDDLIEIDTRSIKKGRTPDAFIRELSRQASAIRGRSYDASIDLQGLWKSAMVAKISGAAKRFGFAKAALREPASRILLTQTIEVPERINVIDKNIALVRGALEIGGDDAAGYEFSIETSAEHRDEAAALAELAGGQFAMINPGGGWATKLWPAENYGRLADRLHAEAGIRSIVVTGPGERELGERVVQGSSVSPPILAEPSLKGLYELAKLSTLYVGGDTGPTHIAAAAGARIVGIFGPTEWWRNGSPFADDLEVGRRDIGCRVDCHRRKCSNWICMDIEVETVLEAALSRLVSVPSTGVVEGAA